MLVDGSRVTRSRVGVVLGVVLCGWCAGAAALLGAARSSAANVTAPGLAGLDALLVTGAAVAGAMLLSWLAAGLVAAVVDLARADAAGAELAQAPAGVRRQAYRVEPMRPAIAMVHTPRVVRRLAAVALGVSLVAGPLAPTSAAASTAAPASVSAGRGLVAVAAAASSSAQPVAAGQQGAVPASWTPDRPAAAITGASPSDVALVATAPRPGAAPGDEVGVRRGDTLWSIAARDLGPGARAEDVARSWPLWWHANRDVIGADPDLITPGQVLRAPTGTP